MPRGGAREGDQQRRLPAAVADEPDRAAAVVGEPSGELQLDLSGLLRALTTQATNLPTFFLFFFNLPTFLPFNFHKIVHLFFSDARA